jgi:predicted amidohydrolase YtcJ
MLARVRTVYRRALLPDVAPEHTDDDGFSAFAVEDGLVGWIGPDGAVGVGAGAPETVDLGGAMVLPAFTDAHVHVTETGVLLDGLDLSGVRSVTALLDLVAAAARERPGRAVLGHGWDELRLAEGRPPTRAELDRAGAGAAVYLTRVDVHSAVLSTALAEAVGARELAGWHDSGRVERDAHHAARHGTRFAIAPAARQALQRQALTASASAVDSTAEWTSTRVR